MYKAFPSFFRLSNVYIQCKGEEEEEEEEGAVAVIEGGGNEVLTELKTGSPVSSREGEQLHCSGTDPAFKPVTSTSISSVADVEAQPYRRHRKNAMNKYIFNHNPLPACLLSCAPSFHATLIIEYYFT